MSGLVTMTPDYCVCWGDKATINANGGVDFENISELDLNGVFTSEFDNYVVYFSGVSTSDQSVKLKFLDNLNSPTTGANYVDQQLEANDNVQGQRFPANTFGRFGSVAPQIGGFESHIYGPALPTPTAIRCVQANSIYGASIYDRATTHSIGAAYAGMRLFATSSSMTGNVVVMGYAE
jgi:hypothetical protein